MDMDRLTGFGRSWAHAPELTVTGSGAESLGFDRSRKCYQLQTTAGKAQAVEFTLSGSKDSPIVNPAFFIKNWNTEGARIFLNGTEFKDGEIGSLHELYGTNLILFLWLESEAEARVRIVP
jgi:hypothetical protein